MMTQSTLPVQLTDRDLRILESLADACYLTVEALEWLHVPSWRTRWEVWYRQTAVAPSGRQSYKSSTSFRKRVRQLAAAGFVLRVKRPLTVGRSLHRDPDLYALRAAGAALLAAYGENAPEAIPREELCTPLASTLVHASELGQVYAALRAAITLAPGARMEAWERGQCFYLEADAALSVRPDASFRLITSDGERRCFVELDRGCSAATWQTKVRAYRALLRERDPTTRWAVLTMTHTRSQRIRLMEATDQVLDEPSDVYLFGVMADAHPSRIGQWLAVTERSAAQPAHPLDKGSSPATIIPAPFTLF